MVVTIKTRWVREANIKKTGNGQAQVALFSYYERLAKSRYKARAEIVALEEGDDFRWPKFLQFFLQNYAKLSQISPTIADLCAVLQQTTETKRELGNRPSQTIHRQRSIHFLNEVQTL